MFYAYILESLKYDKHYYKGHCENLELRLKQHNSGMTESIKPFIPYKILYYEIFETKTDAIMREKYFKSAAGRRFLKKQNIIS